MKFSLRLRMTVACVLLVVVSVGGMLWFSRRDAVEIARLIVESALTQLSGVIEEEVRTGHTLMLQAKVDALTFNNHYLWDETEQFRSVLALLAERYPDEEQRLEIIRQWSTAHLNVGTRFVIYARRRDGGVEDVLGGAVVPRRADVASTSLNRIVNELPPEGVLTVFEDQDRTPCLGVFLPASDPGWTIAAYRELAAVEASSRLISAAILDRMRRLIAGVSILGNGYLAAVDEEGSIQAIREGCELPAAIRRRAAAQPATQRAVVETVLNDPEGSVLYRILPLHPFNWRLVIAVPTRDLEAPAVALTGRLLRLAGVAVLVGVMAAFFMSRHIAEPLSRLTVMARRLAGGDLLRLDPVSLRVSHDEVGELARSFNHMAEQLHNNVLALVEATATRERMRTELTVARDIQEDILPKRFSPRSGRRDVDLHAFGEPAKEVGGDLYDFFFVEGDKLCLIMGDVSDKGVPAALYMSSTVTLARMVMREPGVTPDRALERINVNLAMGGTRGMFVTLFIGLLDLGGGELVWACGGHPPPFVLRSGGPERLESPRELVVGALPHVTYSRRLCALRPGDTIFLYTDGVTEAMNEEQKAYGEAGLRTVLAECAGLSAQETVQRVRAGVARHMAEAPLSDDITMLAVRYTPDCNQGRGAEN